MRHPSRKFIAPVLALVITAGTLTAVAQTKSKTSSSKASTKTEKKETSKYHRLPTYFGQLKLKDEQRQEIYSLKEKFGPKIEALEKELEELNQEMDDAIEDVLTRTQKTALNKLRDGSSKTKTVSSSKSSKSKSESESSDSKSSSAKSGSSKSSSKKK